MASTKMVGTLPYMSPEVFNGVPNGFKSDIWALGCILYTMCALTEPYDAEHMGALCNKVLNETHNPIPDIYSPQLKDLVNLLLTKDHEMRPSITEVLRSPLMSFHLREEGYEPNLIG